jgi:hypothetical protein
MNSNKGKSGGSISTESYSKNISSEEFSNSDTRSSIPKRK